MIGFGWVFLAYGISTIVGHLMPNPLHKYFIKYPIILPPAMGK